MTTGATPVAAPPGGGKGPLEGALLVAKEAMTVLVAGLVLWNFYAGVGRWWGKLGTPDFDKAQSIVYMLYGLVGVVLGYYFGRTPSELSASQARRAEQAARSHGERARAEADAARQEAAGARAEATRTQAAGVQAASQALLALSPGRRAGRRAALEGPPGGPEGPPGGAAGEEPGVESARRALESHLEAVGARPPG